MCVEIAGSHLGTRNAVDPRSTTEKRDVVAKATGVLMVQFGLHRKDAFDELETVARDEQCTVRDAAVRIVRKGGL